MVGLIMGESKYTIPEVGEQSAMIVGLMLQLVLSVNSLDLPGLRKQLVVLPMVLALALFGWIMFTVLATKMLYKNAHIMVGVLVIACILKMQEFAVKVSPKLTTFTSN